MTDPKCEECKWYEEDVGDPKGETHGCKKLNVYTEDARFMSRCGPTGKLFEKREPKQEEA